MRGKGWNKTHVRSIVGVNTRSEEETEKRKLKLMDRGRRRRIDRCKKNPGEEEVERKIK